MTINGVAFTVDLLEILTELQTQLHINGIDLLEKIQPTNGNIMVTCPFHSQGKERRPSAGFRTSDGLFNCLACHEVHSLQEVISFCFGHYDDYIGAFGWNWLIKNFATLQVEDRKDVKIDLLRNTVTDNFTVQNHRLVSKSKSKSDVLGVCDSGVTAFVTEDELDNYRYTHPYWAKRGITDEDIIELFDLGYSQSEKMITFPNLDKDGNCLFVAKRSVKTKLFHYPEGVQKHIYGIYQLYQLEQFPKEIYITESMIDCILLWQVGKKACALNGLGNDIQFKELRDMPCRHFILATDSDKAGMSARQRIKQNVKGKLFSEVILPQGRKDIGECTTDELLNLTEVW